MDYSTLVKQAKQYYSSNDKVEGGAYSIVDKKTKTRKKDPFYLKWCDECEEINLWTYWQGHKNKTAKILLFGQDWACPWDSETGLLMEKIKTVLSDDNLCSLRYIEMINKDDNPSHTDMMLQELMKSLGEEYDPFTPDNENLFFTNLCLGYRDHGSSGGLKKSALLHDVEYAKKLINIVNPKIVICLGKDVYEAMIRGTGSKPVSKERPFYKKLSEGKCYAMYEDRIPIFGQAHTGSLGAINRWRYNPEKCECSEDNKMRLLLNDWSKMKGFLE